MLNYYTIIAKKFCCIITSMMIKDFFVDIVNTAANEAVLNKKLG